MENNLNQSKSQPSLIRHGTVARLRGRIMSLSDHVFGWSGNDTLDFEFEVLTGRYRGRQFWESFPLDISPNRGLSASYTSDLSPTCGWFRTMALLRAMIDSALGLDPHDLSPSTLPKRMLESLADFDRIEFAGKIAVAKVGLDRVNRLAYVIVPGDQRWRRLMGSRAAERLPMGRAWSCLM